jgi:hypothetical protein
MPTSSNSNKAKIRVSRYRINGCAVKAPMYCRYLFLFVVAPPFEKHPLGFGVFYIEFRSRSAI